MRGWLLIGMVIMILVGSCHRVQYVPVERVRIDSVSIRDTVLTQLLVPYKDSVAVADTTSYLSNPYAYSWARWHNGQLHHSLGVLPFASVVVKVPYYIDRYVRITEPQIVEVEKQLSRWQRIKLELGGLSMGALLISLSLIIMRWLWHSRRK